MAGEDAVIAGAFRELRKDFPKLALTIAPRHLDRTPEVENALHEASLDCVKHPNSILRAQRATRTF